MTQDVVVIHSDLSDRAHADALIEMIDLYMRDPMEGGVPASETVKRELVPGLRAHPACHVLLAYQAGAPVGFAICFVGFSTFNARPIINIHDIFVRNGIRGLGIGRTMLERVELLARELKCCRLTLEVRDDNHRARGLYRKFGFAESTLDGARQEFWIKNLR